MRDPRTRLLAFAQKLAAIPCEWGCPAGAEHPCVTCEARRLTALDEDGCAHLNERTKQLRAQRAAARLERDEIARLLQEADTYDGRAD